MKFTGDTIAIVNNVRRRIQQATETIDGGESVSIAVWWTFILDHAMYAGHDPKELARQQLEAFLERVPVQMVREH